MALRKLLPWFATLALLFVAGCSCSSKPGTEPLKKPCKTKVQCDLGDVCVDGFCRSPGSNDGGDLTDAQDHGEIVGIHIEPEDPILSVGVGHKPKLTFEVVADYEDGSTGPVDDPLFELDIPGLGSIDKDSGEFSPNGVIGGTVVVSGSASIAGGRQVATTQLTVRVENAVMGGGVPADIADKFTTLTEDSTLAANILYPLDNVVMPQNVYPADIQWSQGVAGNIFRITVAKPHASITAYMLYEENGKNHWLPGEDEWRSIAQTDPDEDATVVVDRYIPSQSKAYTTAPVHIRFAKAALTGSVYYWNIRRDCSFYIGSNCISYTDTGRIIRINDGTATADDFMPNPGQGCAGCHSVSPSGRYMAARLGGGDNYGSVYDLTTTLTANPTPSIFAQNKSTWWFSSWSPDETRMVVSFKEGDGDAFPNQMKVYDPMTGDPVTVTGSLPSNITHPAWSPDGTQIAYVSGINASEWGGITVKGDISVIDYDGADVFGGTTKLHSGSSLSGDTPGGVADSYPTWSSDSKLIAFAHGTGSRSDDKLAALYVMNRDGSNVVRLANASPGTNNFQPNFSPFKSGGYYWMSFLSKRDYGNAQAGSRGYQQVWVTGIKADASPGEDPSTVPYWLPGQHTYTRNISAFWAPRACREDGDDCSVDAECCGGNCRPDENDNLVCTPPPPDRCREYNETCTSSADCCEGEGLECLDNVCTYEIH